MKKIVFFVKQGLDSFLDDIINKLSEEYETKKQIVTEYSQIDEGMNWADICWFEWCDELVIYGSRLDMSIEKIIICRLHSYEAFTNYINQVNWENVDKLIFVGEYIRKNVISKINIKVENTIVIPNGIDVNKYTYKKREKGFNIAYIGYINYKKNPILLLHAFNEIHKKDNRYILYIAGAFQDERYILYYNEMIKEMGLINKVIYQGWQNDLDTWLEDKNYVICTSVLESQNLSVMQAMSKGIKPVIHNFVGAKEIYPKEYIWNTIDEAVKLIIADNYKSIEYKTLIEQRYSLEKSTEYIKSMIRTVQ